MKLPTVKPKRSTLRGDDVVFMYPAADPASYSAYGCTFLAWGGAAKGGEVRRMESLGIHSTGSMWCLTAGAENCHKNEDLRDAVCRDIEGKPIPVWWLFDCTYEGTPTWFGCTNHPAFRAFVRERVAQEMRGGAAGLHVDDHLGTAHTVAFLGGCFCDHCMKAFRAWLSTNGTAATRKGADVSDWESFDYRDLVRQHAVDDQAYQKQKESIPLHAEFIDCQLQLASQNVSQLGALAAEIVGHPITLSANTALPELPHLAVAKQLTHLVGEVPHHAEEGTAGLLDAVHAYRMAEAIGKPLAATARGYDWAWVKANGSTNLVKIWIALSYSMGQRLMAPHRQWCYTNALGTHWYEGPAGEFAPLYRFVRGYPNLFHETRTLGPLAVPSNVPRTLDTVADRLALQQALADGNPQPLQAGKAWIFPRERTDGSLIIHLLNLDYSPHADHISSRRELDVCLPEIGTAKAATATVYAPDAEPFSIPVRRERGMLLLTISELRIWSVVVIH
jgi:hypothetical protein